MLKTPFINGQRQSQFNPKKKRVLWSETPDDQGKDRSDEVLLSVDEEVLNYFETIFVFYVHC